MVAGRVVFENMTEQGHFTDQAVLAYEIRMTSKPPDSQWRKSHVLMAVAESVEEAIAMCKELYHDDPIIDQVVLLNRGMNLVLSTQSIQGNLK